MYNLQTIRGKKSNYPPRGPMVWLDGADSSSMTISTTISQWNDKSGHGFNAVQATSGLRPTLLSPTLNNRTVVNFNGSKSMSIPAVPLSAFTVFFVFRATANGFLYEQSVDSNSNSGSYLYTSIGQTLLVNRPAGLSAYDYTTNWGAGNVWRVVCHSFNGTNASNQLFINNTSQVLSDTVSTTDPGLAIITDTIFIASRNESSVFLTGDIGEMVIYNSALSRDYISNIFAYLNNKWRIY